MLHDLMPAAIGRPQGTQLASVCGRCGRLAVASDEECPVQIETRSELPAHPELARLRLQHSLSAPRHRGFTSELTIVTLAAVVLAVVLVATAWMAFR